MRATLQVMSSNMYDDDIETTILAGRSIRDIIREDGTTFGYRQTYVAAINGVLVGDHSTIVQEGDILTFREGAKERG